MNLFIKVSALYKKEFLLIFSDFLKTDVPILSVPAGLSWLFTVFIANRNLIRSEEIFVPDRSGYI